MGKAHSVKWLDHSQEKMWIHMQADFCMPTTISSCLCVNHFSDNKEKGERDKKKEPMSSHEKLYMGEGC